MIKKKSKIVFTRGFSVFMLPPEDVALLEIRRVKKDELMEELEHIKEPEFLTFIDDDSKNSDIQKTFNIGPVKIDRFPKDWDYIIIYNGKRITVIKKASGVIPPA